MHLGARCVCNGAPSEMLRVTPVTPPRAPHGGGSALVSGLRYCVFVRSGGATGFVLFEGAPFFCCVSGKVFR